MSCTVARTSRTRCWQRLTRVSITALAAAALFGGCTQAGWAPGYVDVRALVGRHPAYASLAALDEMIRLVRGELRTIQRQPVSIPLPPSRVSFPAARVPALPTLPVEPALQEARAAATQDLARLAEELRRGLREKIERQRAELELITARQVALQRVRLDEQLWQDKLALTKPQSGRLTALQLQVNNLRRLLSEGAILPGQMAPVRSELEEAEANLRSLRTELDGQIAALEGKYADELARFAAQARQQAAADLARYQEEQTREVENLIALGRGRVAQGLAEVEQSVRQVTAIEAGPAPTLDLSRLRAEMAAARQLAAADRAKGIAALDAELVLLQRQRRTLAAAIEQDTRETARAVMAARGVRVTFSRAGRLVGDRTRLAGQAVAAFWASPGR